MKKLHHLLRVLPIGKIQDGTSKLLSQFEGKGWIRWIIGAILVLSLIPMFPRGRSLEFADMKEGSVSTRRIVAPFTFEILKTEEELRVEMQIERQKVLPTFTMDKERLSEVHEQITLFFNEIEKIRGDRKQHPGKWSVHKDSLFRGYNIKVLDNQYRDFLTDPEVGVDSGALRDFRKQVDYVVRYFMDAGIMDVDKERVKNETQQLYLQNDRGGGESYPLDKFYDLTNARKEAAELLENFFPTKDYFYQIGYAIINSFIRPNIIYDEKTHQLEIEEKERMVPLSSGSVLEKERIVYKNDRITPEIRKKLVSLAIVKAERGIEEGGLRSLFPLFGKVLFVLVVLFLLCTFIAFYRPKILQDTKSVFILSLVILIVSIITYLVHHLDASEYLVPSALGAMLLATLFDSRIGYAGAAVIAVLVAGLWGNEFNLMVISFFVGVVGVIAVKRVRDRRHLIKTIFFLVGAYILAITLMGFIRIVPTREIVKDCTFGVLNGLCTPILVYGVLPLLESLFDITTDFSLLEFSNLNHPLLKRLSVEASGTYHHSIIVGNLSEAAAHAVNGNSILARVGSYYHDVGKIEKSEYFVENQVMGENPHEKLTPRMSALILVNHVKKGLEIAKQYKLPSAIMEIIAQHHGTSVMSFFYQKAVKKDGAKEVSIEDYRYPGPRPQTREAAIVMLADTVEAAARSLKEPTHSRLKGIIENLVDERFREGQLDESPLTLRDLERIKENFLTILAGTFHTRIEYPEREESNKSKKQQNNTGKSVEG